MTTPTAARPALGGWLGGIPAAQVIAPRAGAAGERVTVVVTCFNYGHFLPESVRSALDQTGVAVDVVIVDDASTDDSLRVATGIAESDSRVRLVANETNQGPAGAFNVGLSYASGEYVVRLDADDLLTQGSLYRSIALLQHFPSAGFVYGHPLHFSGAAAETSPRLHPRSWTLWSGEQWVSLRCSRPVNCITSPEVVMRRKVLDRVGGMRALAHAHDFELWLRLASASDVGHVDGADQALHRDHSLSLSARTADPVKDLAERRAAFDLALNDSSSALSSDLRLLLTEEASSALAREALRLGRRRMDRGKASPELVESLEDFVSATHPDRDALREWATFQRHKHRRKRTQRSPLALLRGLGCRSSDWLEYRRWERTGL